MARYMMTIGTIETTDCIWEGGRGRGPLLVYGMVCGMVWHDVRHGVRLGMGLVMAWRGRTESCTETAA